MPPSSHAVHRVYRIAPPRVNELLLSLNNLGTWLGVDADADLFMDHPVLRLGDRKQSLVLRFGLSRPLGRIEIESDGHTAPAAAYAGGSIERTLRLIGFRPVFRIVTLREIYEVNGLRAQVLHVDPLGWYLELDGADEPMRFLEQRLTLEQVDRELGRYGDLARALAGPIDRRQRDRRVRDRRVKNASWLVERRKRGDRRTKNRRKSPSASTLS